MCVYTLIESVTGNTGCALKVPKKVYIRPANKQYIKSITVKESLLNSVTEGVNL